MISAPPVIETDRLRLREHRLSDKDVHIAMWADPRVTRFIGGRARTRDETWIRFLRHAGMWHHLGFGFWAICEKPSGRFVGELGLADFMRDFQPGFGDTPEMGWVLSPLVHGKGYASEAIAAALAWADANLAGGRTVCMISPQNEPSLRAAAKAGFREYARADYLGEVVLLERFRP